MGVFFHVVVVVSLLIDIFFRVLPQQNISVCASLCYFSSFLSMCAVSITDFVSVFFLGFCLSLFISVPVCLCTYSLYMCFHPCLGLWVPVPEGYDDPSEKARARKYSKLTF